MTALLTDTPVKMLWQRVQPPLGGNDRRNWTKKKKENHVPYI
jgi:hypothetical protein